MTPHPPQVPEGAKPHSLVPPGGPQGPFWGLLSADGYVVALQIVSKEDAQQFAACPLLVEALAGLRCAGCNQRIGDPDNEPSYPCPSCPTARAALRLAKGEEPNV